MLDVGNDEFVGNILYVAGNSAEKLENDCMNKDSVYRPKMQNTKDSLLAGLEPAT